MILDSKLSTDPDYKGQADLAQLFQSTLFSLHTPDSVRTRLENVVSNYLQTEFADAGNNTGEIGRNGGELLGVLQFSANRAVEAAGQETKDISGLETFVRGFVPRIMGVAAGAWVSSITTPIGGQIANEAVKQLFTQLFGAPAPDSPAELEKAFVEEFSKLGIDLNSGESGIDKMNEIYDTIIEFLNNKLDETSDSVKRDQIQQSINLAEQLNGSLNDGFQNTIDSSQLDQELDRRE